MGGITKKPFSEPSRPERRPEIVADDPYIGRTFGERYEIISKIGEGAQARVYLARHVLIDRPVAVKFLLPVLASDKSLVARFLNEGRAAGALGHPNIVESLDIGFAPDGAPYLVLELLNGRTLDEEIVFARGLLPSRAAYIASQIASALAAAHAQDIVHRDLKPANVLLVESNGRPDHVKVVDFGVSKFTAGGSRVTTITGQPLGTPGFMAPEQIEDPQSIDNRADVYGLGATLYDMLAGEPPFADVGFPKVLRLIVEEEPRKLGDIRPDLPIGLVAIVERAMHKSPALRFQSMAEVENALMAFAEEPLRFSSVEPRYSGVPRSSQVPRPAPSSAPVPPVGLDEPPAGAPKKRKRAIVLLLALLFAGVTSFVVLHDRKPPAEPSSSGVHIASTVARAFPSSLPTSIAPATPVPSAEVDRVAMGAPSAAIPSTRPRDRSTSHVVSRVRPNNPPEAASGINCTPPFFYDGKKKLFKPGCI